MQKYSAASQTNTHLVRQLGWGLLFVLVIGVGYFIFRQFAIDVMPRLEAYNLFFLAVVAGVASFFSPCAFPLLPSYLAFFAAQNDQDGQMQNHHNFRVRAFTLGMIAASGIISFNLILGALIAGLGSGLGTTLSMTSPDPHPLVIWLRGGVGFILITFGVMQWFGYNLKPGFVDQFAWLTRPKREGTQSAAYGLFLYGFGYNAAGMGCTAPILSGLMVFALASGGFQAAMTTFVIFSATMGGLMLIISTLVAQSHDSLIRQLKSRTNLVKQISSILLVGVGLFSLFTVFNRPAFMAWFFPGVNANAMAAAGVSMDFVPPVRGLYEGGEVLFIHTEVSDLAVAQRLTEMMGPDVVYMPRLAETPPDLLGKVYVFTNGIAGSGPFGFQPDVFDSVPGDVDYSPLRLINLVTWVDDATPQQLTTLTDIQEAAKAGIIGINETDIVVNMPILTWPTGQR